MTRDRNKSHSPNRQLNHTRFVDRTCDTAVRADKRKTGRDDVVPTEVLSRSPLSCIQVREKQRIMIGKVSKEQERLQPPPSPANANGGKENGKKASKRRASLPKAASSDKKGKMDGEYCI